MSFSFSQDLIKEFFEKGYFVVPDLFNSDEIFQISESFNRLYEKAMILKKTGMCDGSYFVFDYEKLHRIVWCGAAEPNLLKIAEDRRLLEPVATLLDSSKMEQLICQAHFKMPKDEVIFPWHQDSSNRGYGTSDWMDVNGKGSYVQTVIAIDEMTSNNGPLLFLPGSCKDGHLPENHPILREMDESQLVPLLMKPGSVAFFGPYTVHGSLKNNSSFPRRVLINGFGYPGANRKIYPGEGSGRLLELNQ